MEWNGDAQEIIPQAAAALLVDKDGGVGVGGEDDVDGLPEPRWERIVHFLQKRDNPVRRTTDSVHR